MKNAATERKRERLVAKAQANPGLRVVTEGGSALCPKCAGLYPELVLVGVEPAGCTNGCDDVVEG